MVDTFLTFFVAMAKRELFIWKRKHEAMLLREVLVEEPHKYRPGSKERGISWTKIAEHLQESGMKVTQRSAREKFDKLYQDFKKRENEESRASGVDVEYDEIYQALTNIHDQIVDWQEQQQVKEESEKATAEEMRKRATEKIKWNKTKNQHGRWRKLTQEAKKPHQCHGTLGTKHWEKSFWTSWTTAQQKERAWIARWGIASTTAIPSNAASATATIPAATTALTAATARNEHSYVKYTCWNS